MTNPLTTERINGEEHAYLMSFLCISRNGPRKGQGKDDHYQSTLAVTPAVWPKASARHAVTR